MVVIRARARARVRGLAVVASIALWGSHALAQDELLHLKFQSASDCPGRAAFIAEVRARTERVRFVDTTRNALQLEVHADVGGDRAVGRLRLGSENADRRVTGKTCVDVMSALALIAALAVDPTAWSGTSVEGRAAGVALPAVRAKAAGEDLADGPADLATTPPAALRDPSASRDTSEATPSGKTDRPSSIDWFGGVGAAGEFSRGLGAGAITMAGASLYAEAGIAAGARWRPALRASLVFTQSPTMIPDAQPDSGAAAFTLIASRVALCPLEFRPRETLVIRPCASFEVGRLEGRAKPVDNGRITSLRSGQMLRLAAGQSIQARARLAGSLWFELEAGAIEPLLRQKFVFSNPDVTVSSVPAIELAAALGLGVHFP
jgi:hypothetical protein